MPTTAIDDWRPVRVGVVGAGAMGTSLAAMLGSIVPVVMVCIVESRAGQLRSTGARTRGLITAESRPEIVRRIEDLANGPGLSAVFVATKTTAISEVARELRPVLSRLGDQPTAPFIVSYQNGIEPGRQMIEQLGDDRVLRMVLNFGAHLDEEDGCVDVTLDAPPHSIGCLNPAHRPACQRLAALLSRAGLRTEFDEQIESKVWTKGVLNAAMSPVAALVNSTVGEVLDSPARAIVDRLLREGFEVARREGLDLGQETMDHCWEVLESARGHTPSMVEDIRAGRESEVGQLNRQVLEHAQRVGVPTPTHEVIDALIETFDWKVYAEHMHVRQ